jgi:hypothetical protein
VLGTKLHVLATRRPLVARPRLTELVRSGASELARLVLVSAPAGFGKTTLLSQWLSPTRPGGQAPHVAWLSLDEGDNDLRRLLAHLVALDDYHVIDNAAVHKATSFLKVQGFAYLAGGLLFGIALYRAHVLARWAAVLLAVGGVVSAALSVMPDAFYRLLAYPNGIAMIGLGYSLWSTARRDVSMQPAEVGDRRATTTGGEATA